MSTKYARFGSMPVIDAGNQPGTAYGQEQLLNYVSARLSLF